METLIHHFVFNKTHKWIMYNFVIKEGNFREGNLFLDITLKK